MVRDEIVVAGNLAHREIRLKIGSLVRLFVDWQFE
jgi:hypothetical protein